MRTPNRSQVTVGWFDLLDAKEAVAEWGTDGAKTFFAGLLSGLRGHGDTSIVVTAVDPDDDVLLVEPKPLAWSKEYPTVPGWYWFRKEGERIPYIERLCQVEIEHECIYSATGEYPSLSFECLEFFGLVYPPLDASRVQPAKGTAHGGNAASSHEDTVEGGKP